MATTDRRGVSVDATDSPTAGAPNPGLAIKTPCAVATTASITLSGVQAVDGVTVGNNAERVLVWQQADATTNGIYNASSGPWTRATDANSNDQWTAGMLVLVAYGATYTNAWFECVATNPVTLGSSAISFIVNNVPSTRNVNTTAPLAGGGPLATDLTLVLAINGSLQVTGGQLAVAPLSAVSHKWVSSINAAGIPQLTQPTAADIAGGQALSASNDSNVTLTLGGSYASALLGGASLTMGWSGTLAAGRLNSNVVQGITNDTNITGSISAQNLTFAWSGTLAAGRLNSNVVQGITNDTNITGSISAQNLTFGWSGTLAVARGGTGGGAASGTLLDNITGFSATGFLIRTGAGSYAFQSATNGITNANLAQGGAATLKGNPTAATANVQDFTIQGLTNLASPNANLDYIPIYNHSTGTIQNVTPGAIASSATAGVATLNGANGALTLADISGGAVNTSGTAITIGSPGGLINLLRNGPLDIWQRGTGPLTVTTAGAYTADGFIVLPTGASVTVAKAAGRALTLNSLKVTGAASVTDVVVRARIESYLSARATSQTVTVQGWVYNSTGAAITPKLSIGHPSTADTYSSVGAASLTNELNAANLPSCANGAWTQFAYAAAISSSAANGLEINLDFGNSFGSTSDYIQLAELDVRVTPGVATGLTSNPPPPELRPIFAELPFCQRYFATSYANGVGQGTTTHVGMAGPSYGVSGIGGGLSANTMFPVPLRQAPGSISYWDGAGNVSKVSYTASGSASFTDGGSATLAPSNLSATGFIWSGNTTSGNNSFLHYSASAEL